MITEEELLRISKITGMKPHQQEKHYIQTLILRSIYSRFDPVFKGGTALMFLEGLNRFSEDMDFTAQNPLDTEELGSLIVRDMGYFGVNSTFKKVNETWAGFSFKISAEGPLFTREIEKCHIRVEISMRERIIAHPESRFIEVPYPDMLPFSIVMMNPEELMAEKVRAIITREKARDVYDLWFLVRKGWITGVDLVDEKLSYYGEKFDISVFEESLERKGQIWMSELRPIIFGRLPEFVDVKSEILRDIDRWLRGL